MNVSVGSCCPELAQAHSSVALAWHNARGSTPFGVTNAMNPNEPQPRTSATLESHPSRVFPILESCKSHYNRFLTTLVERHAPKHRSLSFARCLLLAITGPSLRPISLAPLPQAKPLCFSSRKPTINYVNLPG